MFNKNLIRTLSSLSTISNSLIVRYPITVLTDASRSLAVKLDISKIDDSQFQEFGLYESLNKFTSIFNIFDNPTVSLQDNVFHISDANNRKTTFITDNVALLNAFDMNSEVFEKIRNANSVAEFDLSISTIKALRDAQRIYADLDKVEFKGSDDGIEISLSSQGKFNARNNTFSITTNDEVKKNFDLFIMFETLIKLPLVNYHVAIKYNENRDMFRFFITSEDMDCIEILLSPTIA